MKTDIAHTLIIRKINHGRQKETVGMKDTPGRAGGVQRMAEHTQGNEDRKITEDTPKCGGPDREHSFIF